MGRFHIIICHPFDFDDELNNWITEMDSIYEDYITNYKLKFIVSNNSRNGDLCHYIKYHLTKCEN